jgi:hypothetical protein
MVRRFFLFGLLPTLLFAFSVTAFAGCGCPDWREAVGEYDTVEVERYRGGQTSREEAMEQINKKILISESQFSILGEVTYNEPVYEIICYPVPQEEGEVPLPSERRGDFYGFGMDRDVINVLYVTPLREEGPRYHFEVVGDELWFFFDGWFYRTRRVSN